MAGSTLNNNWCPTFGVVMQRMHMTSRLRSKTNVSHSGALPGVLPMLKTDAAGEFDFEKRLIPSLKHVSQVKSLQYKLLLNRAVYPRYHCYYHDNPRARLIKSNFDSKTTIAVCTKLANYTRSSIVYYRRQWPWAASWLRELVGASRASVLSTCWPLRLLVC